MQFTKKSRETVDACRFCWMCRHICPIGNATGQERNTSRARAFGLSMVDRGKEKLEDFIDNVYECTLCGACTKECMTGWDPTFFTAEAKLEAALAGVTPEYIGKMLDKLEATGNLYGTTAICSRLTQKIETLPKSADILFLAGQDARCKAPETVCDAIDLLQKAGVAFTALTEEPESGYGMYFLVGPAEETRQAMKNVAAILNQYTTVIVYDPNDAKFLSQQYKEWGIELTAEIRTFTSYLADLLDAGQLTLKQGADVYTFQDPAALARGLNEVEPARKLLDACGKRTEFLLNGKDVMIPGSLFMNEYLPEVTAQVAADRWRAAANAGAKIVVTACPSDYVCLAAVKPESIDLMTIEKMVLKCL